MKKRNALLLVLSMCMLTGLISCSDNDDKKEEKGIAVQTIAATSTIDLSDRTGWMLRLGYMYNSPITYKYTIDGKRLTATSPTADPYYFDKQYKEGDMLHPLAGLTIRLASPGYYEKIKGTGPTPALIQDQSTREKFLNADLLSCEYTDIVSKDIKDVRLIHDNALLHFVAEGIPAGAKVIAYQSFTKEITPLLLTSGQNELHYQAIVLSGYSTAVAVIVGEDYYTAYLNDENTKMRGNTRYTFNVNFDSDTKKVTISDLTSSDWEE